MSAPTWRQRLRAAGDILLVSCAVAITVTVVRRPGNVVVAAQAKRVDSSFVANWRELASRGIWHGSHNAPIVIIEFGDFECPACRAYAPTLAALRREADVAIIFRQWPLEYHRFALMASRSALCADRQDRFWQMHDVLYANQDSLGIRSWPDLAKLAGLDVSTFDTCLQQPIERSVAEVGRHDAANFKAIGTPAILVNGWYLGDRPPSEQEWRKRLSQLRGSAQ